MSEHELTLEWKELNDLYEVESNNLKVYREQNKNSLQFKPISDEILKREKKLIDLKSKANVIMAKIYNLKFDKVTSANKKSR